METLAGYNVYRSAQPGGPYAKVNSALVFATSYADFTATPGTRFYYVYRVVNTSLEEGPNSNEASGVPSDDSAPVITHTPIGSASAGSTVTIVALISDNVTVAAASLFYRPRGAAGPYTQVAMTNATGIQYAANIPAGAVAEPGVEYYIQASDGIHIATHGSAGVPHIILVGTYQRGDANGDGNRTALDVSYLLNYLYGGGSSPIGSGDCNSDGQVNVLDVFYLVNHLFHGGPAPL